MDPGICLRINSPGVVCETIDGEVIIINLDNGAYYSLQGTAAEIWGCVDDHGTVDEVMARMAHHYNGDPAQVGTEVMQFLDLLAAESLIVPDSALVSSRQESEGARTEGPRPEFDPPKLEKYTDMEEFLLVDPIHEVGEQGWPHTQDDTS
jgi:hypothetical protein